MNEAADPRPLQLFFLAAAVFATGFGFFFASRL